MLSECTFNQLVVNQTQRRGKEGGFSRCHPLGIIYDKLGIPLGKPFQEEPDFHVQDLTVTGGDSSEEQMNEESRQTPTLQQRKKRVLA